MRVLGLSVIAFHGATAAVRGGIPGDSPHEPLAGEISVAAVAAASKQRGSGDQRLALADLAETLPTVGRQAEMGINLEGDKARERKVEPQRNSVASRGFLAQARTGSDRGEERQGHHLTLEQTLRVETNTGGDGREGSATPPPPPPPLPLPRAVWRHNDAEEASGGGDGGLPLDEDDSSVDVRVGPTGDGNGANARADGGDGGSISRDGGEEDGDGGGGGGPLERCYSSPAADPSHGAWKECQGGEEECSPTRTTRGNWAGKWGTDFNHCSALWAARHPERGSRPYWRWEPANCRLEEVTADGFCGAMEGRKGLLLVGDSLTRHFTLTLAAALGARHVSTSKFASDLFLACGDSLRVMHYRNDLLDTRVEEFPTAHCLEPDHGSTRCTLFAGIRHPRGKQWGPHLERGDGRLHGDDVAGQHGVDSFDAAAARGRGRLGRQEYLSRALELRGNNVQRTGRHGHRGQSHRSGPSALRVGNVRREE
ncbi:unnamed protein product [Scytosiphon promiscuus]